MPVDADPTSIFRRWLAAFGAGALGFGLNFLPFAIMPSVQFIFGAIPALIVALAIGPRFGMVAAFLASLATIPLWGHPVAVILFTLEAAFVGAFARRFSPMGASICYWLLLGAPLMLAGYLGALHLPLSVVGPLLLKQVLNGWLDVMAAMVAIALFPAWPIFSMLSGRPTRRQPLQRVLLIVMAMLAVVPIFFAGGAYGRFRWEQEMDRLVQAQHLRGDAIAGVTQRYVDTRVGLVKAAAQLIGERPTAPAFKLRVFQESVPGILHMVLGDARGHVVAAYPPASHASGLPGASLADRDDYQALERGAPSVVSGLVADGATPTVIISAPIVHGGRFDGYVSAALDLGYMRRMMDHWQLGATASGLVDEQGRYIVPPPGAQVMARSELWASPPDGQSGETSYIPDGRPSRTLAANELERRVAYHARVPGYRWQVWVEDPVALVQARTEESYLAVMGWMALGVLMAFLVSLWLSRYLARPLLALAKDSQAFAHGDMGALKQHPPMPVEELETLALNLEEMAAQVRHKEANLEMLVRERTAELQLANGQLEGALSELRHLDRAKADFLNVISHELRTPLNFIMGFSSFLEDEGAGALNGQQHHYLQRILEGSERLLELVNNLLDYARMEAGNFRVEPSAIALAPLLESVATDLRPLAEKKVLDLDWRVAQELPMVLADRARIEQVLLNLVGNAIKFTPEGGRVTMTAEPGPDRSVWVRVADTGIGIAPEAMPKLFTKFYQVDGTTTRAYGGTGLGLAIVKSLIEAHGGRVTVESAPHQGSTFTFTLPAIPSTPGLRPEEARGAGA